MKAYIQANVRRILCEEDITLERAMDFLDENRDGIIILHGQEITTKEELEYVKSIRSLTGDREDSSISSGGEIYEDPSRELPRPFGNHSE